MDIPGVESDSLIVDCMKRGGLPVSTHLEIQGFRDAPNLNINERMKNINYKHYGNFHVRIKLPDWLVCSEVTSIPKNIINGVLLLEIKKNILKDEL